MAVTTQLGMPSEIIPGRRQNCKSFGEWEREHSSLTAKLCHGGTINDGSGNEGNWLPCEVRFACKERKDRTEGRGGGLSLPVYGQGPASRTIAEMSPSAPMRVAHIGPWRAENAPTTQGQLGTRVPSKPGTWQPEATFVSGMSPTYVPAQHESVWMRLFHNIANGVIAALGYHLLQMAQHVDIFGGRRQHPPRDK